MKLATEGTRTLLFIFSAIALLAWTASTKARSAGDSPQVTDSHCNGCIVKTIDLGLQAKGVTAQFFVPPNVPLEFPEIHLNYLPNGGVQGGFYVVKNDSKAGLVSVTTSWFTHVDGPNAPPAPATDCRSSWATGRAFLAPGASMKEPLNFGLIPYKGHAVVRITGVVTFAEFEDGTKAGPGVDTLEPQIRARRAEVLTDYHHLLSMIRAGLPDAQLEQYVQATPRLKGLELVRARKGWNGVAAEISKRLHLIGQQAR